MTSLSRFLFTRRFVAVSTGAMILYMFGWCTEWTFNPFHQPWAAIDHYFTAQADAILNGRLWVDQTSLRPGMVNECFYRDGRCFGYFGVTPSLLRIPILLIFGASTSSFAPVMIPLAAGVAYGAALDLCRVVTREIKKDGRSAFLLLMTAAALGPGSILVVLGDPFVYQEAILWSAAGTLVAVNLFWRWWYTDRTGFIVGCIIACGLAAGARPTSLAVGPILALAVVIRSRQEVLRRPTLIALMSLFIIFPVAMSFGVVQAKFGEPGLPKTYAEEAGTVRVRTGPCDLEITQGLRYVPTNLYAYLRPDAIQLSAEWPVVRARFAGCIGPTMPTYLWPLKPGDLYVEKTTSLSSSMPFPVLATVAAFGIAARRRRYAELALLIAAGTVGLSVALNMAQTTRYVGDFYPIVAVGTVLSVSALMRNLVRPRYMTLTAATIVALTLWGILANTSLYADYGWIFLNP